MAVASAGHLTTQFFTGRMPFLPPNQQCQSTEGHSKLSRYQKSKTNLDFTEARDSEWQWHQPGHMQICTSLQTDNHANTPSLSFLQAVCPFCHPTNSVKALKAQLLLLLILLLHPFNGLFSRTTCVSQYQKGKTSLNLNEARDDGVLG